VLKRGYLPFIAVFVNATPCLFVVRCGQDHWSETLRLYFPLKLGCYCLALSLGEEGRSELKVRVIYDNVEIESAPYLFWRNYGGGENFIPASLSKKRRSLSLLIGWGAFLTWLWEEKKEIRVRSP